MSSFSYMPCTGHKLCAFQCQLHGIEMVACSRALQATNLQRFKPLRTESNTNDTKVYSAVSRYPDLDDADSFPLGLLTPYSITGSCWIQRFENTRKNENPKLLAACSDNSLCGQESRHGKNLRTAAECTYCNVIYCMYLHVIITESYQMGAPVCIVCGNTMFLILFV